jgi:hypothetical protein
MKMQIKKLLMNEFKLLESLKEQSKEVCGAYETTGTMLENESLRIVKKDIRNTQILIHNVNSSPYLNDVENGS